MGGGRGWGGWGSRKRLGGEGRRRKGRGGESWAGKGGRGRGGELERLSFCVCVPVCVCHFKVAQQRPEEPAVAEELRTEPRAMPR